ncbi:helix-turn-helix domain-containing protein [Chloroflexota bacterium]
MYSTKEASEQLGLSQSHVRYLARERKIKAKWIGRDWVILELNYTRKNEPGQGRKKGE